MTHRCTQIEVDAEGRVYRCSRSWPHVGRKHFMRLIGRRISADRLARLRLRGVI
jgi:hypothetical protein